MNTEEVTKLDIAFLFVLFMALLALIFPYSVIGPGILLIPLAWILF